MVEGALSQTKVTGFGTEALWDDGKAEVSRYEATLSRYGKRRSFELTLVAVKEAFDPRTHLKADDPDQDDLQVFKLQTSFVMPTENYDYHMASSTFVKRAHPFVLIKLRTTSHELCGITTKHLDLRGETPMLHTNSYFESEGIKDTPLPWPEGGVTEEQLLFAVRALPFEPGLSMPLHLLSRQLTSHAEPPQWRPGELKVAGPVQAAGPQGVEVAAWQVVVRLEGGEELVYEVEQAPPHRLLSHTGPDGFSLRLKASARWAYWDPSQPAPFGQGDRTP